MGDGDARLQRLGLVGLAFNVALALGLSLGALELRSLALAGAAAQLLAGIPVWLALAIIGWSRRRVAAEQLEAARLEALAREGRQSVFAREGLLVRDAEQSLRRLERGGAIGFTLAVAALELGGAWGLALWFPHQQASASLTAAALLCLCAFGELLLARYGFALAARAVQGAGAAGRRASAAAALVFLAGLAQAGMHSLGLAALDQVGWVAVGVEAVLGLEALLLLLLDVYRPRRPGVVARPPWDSRLLGLLATPGDIARSIARAVDYQFGFGISQTWLYRFLERWVLPLIGFAVLAFWALSALVVVPAHSQGLHYRLGRLREPALGPGLHLKLPWPLDAVELLPVGRLLALRTGTGAGDDDHEEEHELEAGAREETLLWTRSHVATEEDLVLLARRGVQQGGDVAPVNLLAASGTIHYRIEDALEHARHVADPSALLGVLAERELSFTLASADLDALLQDRGREGARLGARLQQAARLHGLGLDVVGAYLTDLHPPVEVGQAFEALTAALEQREAEILSAGAEAARLGPSGELEAENLRRQARSAAATKVLLAAAEARRLAGLLALDRAAPGVFRLVRLLDELVDGAAHARKVVLAREGEVLSDLDLEDRIQAEDLPLGESMTGAPGGASGKKE